MPWACLYAGTLLALDAAFHTGVAALTGRVQRLPRCKGEDVGSAAAAAGGEGGGRGGKGGANASDKEAIRASLQVRRRRVQGLGRWARRRSESACGVVAFFLTCDASLSGLQAAL